MNAFTAGLIAELNAGSTDTVEFSHFNKYHKMVVRRHRNNKLYTFVKDIRGKIVFMPVL